MIHGTTSSKTTGLGGRLESPKQGWRDVEPTVEGRRGGREGVSLRGGKIHGVQAYTHVHLNIKGDSQLLKDELWTLGERHGE